MRKFIFCLVIALTSVNFCLNANAAGDNGMCSGNSCRTEVDADPACQGVEPGNDCLSLPPHASKAICKDILVKKPDTYKRRCVALDCEEDSLLVLRKTDGGSDGICHTIKYAEKICREKCTEEANSGNECAPNYQPNPNTHEDKRAYRWCVPVPKHSCAEIHAGNQNAIDCCEAARAGEKVSWNGSRCVCEDDENMEWNRSKKQCVEKKKADIKPDDKPIITEEYCHYWFEGYIICRNNNKVYKVRHEYPLGKTTTTNINGNLTEEEECAELDNLLKEDKERLQNLSKSYCYVRDAKSNSRGKVSIRMWLADQGKEQSEGEEKLNKYKSAQSDLSDFFATAKASGWRTADGKFNTVRLVSDIGAGVVLGTVGGVVSGVVIKKKQIEKGFEALKCSVGGQNVATWGDTFTVGLTR